MDAAKITPEQITQAYAMAKAQGVSFGTKRNPKTYAQFNGGQKMSGTLEAAIPQLRGFAPDAIARALHTADGELVTFDRLIGQWVLIAFNPEEDTTIRMRAMDKLERILVSIAVAHPAAAERVEKITAAARRAAKSPRSEEGRRAAQEASGDSTYLYADYLKKQA